MLIVVGNFLMGAMALALFWATTSLGRGANNRMTAASREVKTMS